MLNARYPGEVQPEILGQSPSLVYINQSVEERSYSGSDNPLYLDVESAAIEAFDLNPEDAQKLSLLQNRALTLLAWNIDEIIDQNLEAAPENMEEMAKNEAKFVKDVSDATDLAALVVGGNVQLTRILSNEYGEKIGDEVSKLRRDEGVRLPVQGGRQIMVDPDARARWKV